MYEHDTRTRYTDTCTRSLTHKGTRVHSAENNARPFLLYDRARFDGQLLNKQAVVHADSLHQLLSSSHVTSICISLHLLVILLFLRLKHLVRIDDVDGLPFLESSRIEFCSSFDSHLSSVYEGKGLR